MTARGATRNLFYQQPTTDKDVLESFWNPEEFLTRRQIAERVGRKPHKALNDRIERLCNEGKIERYQESLPNGRPQFWYKKGEGK